MAKSYERLIEFKVAAKPLRDAVARSLKDLRKLDSAVGKVNGKVERISTLFKKSSTEIAKVTKQVTKLGAELNKAYSKANRLSNSLLGLIKKLGVGTGKGGAFGFTKLIGELGLFDAGLRKITGKGLPYFTQRVKDATTALGGFALAHAGVIAGVSAGAIVLVRSAQLFYGLGKSARQAVVSFNELRAAYAKGGFQGLFPAGSILGGNKTKEDIKAAVAESKKLEKTAQKVAYKYKEAATGLNKLREQLDKSRRIQDKLLAGSDRYLKIAKNTLSIEKQIAKEEQKRANILKRMTLLDRARKGVMSALGGKIGIAKGAGEGVAGLIGADQAIRKLSGVFGKQIGLYKAVTKGSEEFFKALQAVNKAAGNAIVGLDKYGRQIYEIISSHQRLIQSFAGVTAGLAITAKFTPQIFAAGKAWRQLEYDIRRVGKAFADSGFRGVGQLFPAGSMIGKRARGREAGDIAFDGKAAATAVAKADTAAIRSQIDGLNKVNQTLSNNKKIQENINAFTLRHIQAVIAVRKAQTAVNHELLRTKVTQALITSDIWAAQKAWQGLVGIIKGATGVLGKVVGGVFGTQIGKEAAVIGISRTIESLITKIPLLNKEWERSIAVHAKWVARVTEGISAVRLGYAGLERVLGAASWVTGAVTGFINFERQAALSFQRVNQMRRNLDKDLSEWLGGGRNPFARGKGQKRLGIWDKLRGRSLDPTTGRVKGRFEEQLAETTAATPALLSTREAALTQSKQHLAALQRGTAEYTHTLKKIVTIEQSINKEIAARKSLYESVNPEALQQKVKDAAKKTFDATSKYQEKELAHIKGIKAQKLRMEEHIFQDKLAKEEQLTAKELKNDKKINDANLRNFDRRLARAGARREKGQRFRENLMLGAGFPLLFGGGVGAVGGGVLGAGMQSAMGSKGFGMQILFSALGQQLDAIAARALQTAKAFTSLDGAFTLMTERSLWSSKAVEKQALILQKQGKSAELAALLTKEYVKILGSDGIRRMQELGEKSKEAAKQWGTLRTQLELLLTGPLTQIMEWLNKFLARKITSQSLDQTYQGLINSGQKDKAAQLRAALIKDRSIGDLTKGTLKNAGAEYTGINSMLDITGVSTAHMQGVNQRFSKFLPSSTASIPSTGDGTKGAEMAATLQAEIAHLKEIGRLGRQEAEIRREINKHEKEGVENAEKLVRQKYALTEQLQRTEALYGQIGAVIKDGLVDAIEGAIEGTKTLGDVASSVFRQIARLMLNYGVSAGLGSIGIKTRASGGPVTGGKPYIVGEKGPELFTPSSSGKITPNHELGGNVSVNVAVDASGSSAQGDEPSAQELGRLIGAAVQSELVRQKRPGGILY